MRDACGFEGGDVDASGEAGDGCQGVNFGGDVFGRGGDGLSGYVARGGEFGAGILGMEVREDFAGGGEIFRFGGVKESKASGLKEGGRREFRPVAPVGGGFREFGFDLGGTALRGVEGDGDGDKAGGEADVLVGGLRGL